MRNQKAWTVMIPLFFALIIIGTLSLAGCSNQVIGVSNSLKYQTFTTPDNREIECVVYVDHGLSCNWATAILGDPMETP